MRISDWSSDVCSSDLFSTLLEDGKHPFAARIFDHAALTDDGVDQLGRRDVEYRVERIETHWRDRHATEFREFAGEAFFDRNMRTIRPVEIEGDRKSTRLNSSH